MDKIHEKESEIDLLNEVAGDLKIYEKKNELDLLNEIIEDLDDAMKEASKSITPSLISDPLLYFRNMRRKYMEKKMELSDELINLMLDKLNNG